VADSEMFVLWKHQLKQKELANGWVLDGFPRNISQARFLDNKLNKYGRQITAVFYLKVSEDESLKRLFKRGRRNPDGSLHDTEEKIRERLKIYNKSEAAVLDFYRKKNLLIEINGEQMIDEIFKDIYQRAGAIHA
jgi:adenylate kinase